MNKEKQRFIKSQKICVIIGLFLSCIVSMQLFDAIGRPIRYHDEATVPLGKLLVSATAKGSECQVWNRSSLGATGDSVWGDGMGNIYTCGNKDGSGGYPDLVLIKWSSAGIQQWNRTWGGAFDDRGYSVWGDSAGYIYTCGFTQTGATNYDVLLVKWSSTGSEVWSRTWGGSYFDAAYSVWGDDTGDVYTCGTTGPVANPDILYLLLVKWSSAGSVVWSRTWTRDAQNVGLSVWGDGAGNIYTSGYWGHGTSSPYAVYFGALIKWSRDGVQLWNRTWSKSTSDRGYSVWGDTAGNIYTCGYTGLQYPVYGVYDDMMLIKWSSAGTQLWNRTWGSVFDDSGYSVWGDSAGYVYTCGYTCRSGSYDYDLVLVKWSSAGSEVWNCTWGGSSRDSGKSVWGDTAGYIYTCGYTSSFGASGLLLVKWPPYQVPAITPPPDITYTIGMTGKSIAWSIIDDDVNTTSYTIYLDSVVNVTGTWISRKPVKIRVNGLSTGSYNYTIVASDGLGGTRMDTVIVKVIPNIPPAITHPGDITYSSGTTGNKISWNITDSSVGNTTMYNIYRNGLPLVSGWWTSLVIISVDGLSIGSYNYTIIASDGLDSSVQDTVVVTVISPINSLDVVIIVAIFAAISFSLAAIVRVEIIKRRKAQSVMEN